MVTEVKSSYGRLGAVKIGVNTHNDHWAYWEAITIRLTISEYFPPQIEFRKQITKPD